MVVKSALEELVVVKSVLSVATVVGGGGGSVMKGAPVSNHVTRDAAAESR